MDIPALSIALSTSQLMTDVNVALMKNIKETVNVEAAGVVELLDSAVPPADMGSMIDISI